MERITMEKHSSTLTTSATKKYVISLRQDEKNRLVEVIKKGKEAARKIARAHILLLADKGLGDEDIVGLLHVSLPTVGRVRKRYCTEGLESALNERPRPGARRKIKNEDKAMVSALLLTPPPNGHNRWSLRMIADKLVELQLVDSISHETVRNVLKTRSLPVNP